MSTELHPTNAHLIDGLSRRPHPHRRTIAALAGLTAIGAAGGAAAMLVGEIGMPVSTLEPLGLDSWVLPAFWLFATVTMPCAIATLCSLRRWPSAPETSVVAGGLLAVELLVQIPFVGPNPLQAVFGLVAVALVVLGLDARRKGWR